MHRTNKSVFFFHGKVKFLFKFTELQTVEIIVFTLKSRGFSQPVPPFLPTNLKQQRINILQSHDENHTKVEEDV